MSLDHNQSKPPEAAPQVLSRRGLGIAAVSLVVLVAAVVVVGLSTRKMADARLNEWTEERATPTVAVARLDSRGRMTSIDLPGRLEAYSQAQLYARVSGYIKEWKADIGARVKAGDLLAEIDAPDLDQQIMQSQANLASATANAALSAATLQRGQSLLPSGSISKQDLDQRTADASNKQGIAKSMQADLDRMRVLERYKKIVAPFDGLVTARATDVGSLINAGASGGPALFVVSDVSRLRVYVNVPQSYVPSIKIGTNAKLVVPEYPGRDFTATVEASAQSVDPASGTTRMQLVVDNTSGELMTGAYSNVRLELPRPDGVVTVPASALIFDQNGVRIATVGDGNRVELKQVTIARDMGKEIEIGAGLTKSDRVIESPPDGIASGDAVRLVGEPAATTKSAREAPPKPRG
jgi:RND family efflux transporter MFP subunit